MKIFIEVSHYLDVCYCIIMLQNGVMKAKNVNFETSSELISYLGSLSQDDTSSVCLKNSRMNSLTLIAPQLETKKRLVNECSQHFKTIPDTLILRMGEFFKFQMQTLKPHVEFIDKSLLLLQLTSKWEFHEFQAKNSFELEKIVEYTGVFSPIIGHSSYRKTFEEFISEDDFFKQSYSQLYPLIIKLWDFITESPYMVSQWTLGWLFNHLEDLKKLDRRVIIYEPESMKKIEKDFFEELSESWEIEYLNSEFKNSKPKKSSFKWIKSKSVFDEMAVLSQNKIQNSETSITFVIPQKRKYYLALLDLFFISNKIQNHESFSISKFKCLSLIKKKIRQIRKKCIKRDILESSDLMKSKFSSKREWEKLFLERIDLEPLASSEASWNSESSLVSLDKKMSFISFVQSLTFLKNEKKLKEEEIEVFYKFLYSKASGVPCEIEVFFEEWVYYLELIIESDIEKSSLKSSLKLDITTLEDVQFTPERQYYVLGCSQQAYEVNPFTYLSDYEINKIQSDLGFNLEGLNLPLIYLDKFKKAKYMGVPINFYSSEFNVFGDKENDPKFLKDLWLSQEIQVGENKDCSEGDREECKDFISLSSCQLNLEDKKPFRQEVYSASSLQKYIDCPFKYFGEYVLCHKDIDFLDYEPSPLIRGNITHELLEHFLGESPAEVSEVQNKINILIKKNYEDWPQVLPLKLYFKNTGLEVAHYVNRDLDQRRAQNRKNLYKELDFKAYFDLESMTFSREQKKGAVAFKGYMDRVDSIGDSIYIFDYKLSKPKNSSYTSWLHKGLIQMPLYGLVCLDNALPESFPKGHLHQLSYIITSEQYVTKLGLSVKGDSSQNLGLKMNSKNSVSSPHLMAEALKGFRKLIRDTLLSIQKGNFSPAPLSQNICEKCHWKLSCKANHL